MNRVSQIGNQDFRNPPKVEVEAKPFATSLERALERLLAGMHQLVPLELARLHKRLAALSTDMHARTVRMQVLAHRRVVPEHLIASLVRTR